MNAAILNRSPWALAAVLTALAGAAMAVVDLLTPTGGSLWQDWQTEQDTLVYFCEPARLNAFLRQQVDTYSNLGFCFAGCLMWAHWLRDRAVGNERHIGRHGIWSLAYAVALWATFLGSSLFHASLTVSGEALDLAGTYASVLLPGFYNLHRLADLRGRAPRAWPFLLLFMAVWLTCSLLIFRLSSRIVVPSGLLLLGISAVGLWFTLPRGGRRAFGWMALSLALTVAAATCFVMDIQKVGCAPESWIQAHAFWHLLGAAAAACYYAFMRALP